MSNLLLIVFYRLLRLSVYGVYSRRTSSLLARHETRMYDECLFEGLLKREAFSSGNKKSLQVLK